MSRQKGEIMREVLISIQPKWCKLICSGEKTAEVRKNRPNCELPFKCYIYCTKGKPTFSQSAFCDAVSNRKVIGEFVGDKIVEVQHDPYDPAFSETADLSCVGIDGLSEYLGHKDYGYGWHITDLVVYDEPRELSEFKTPNWYADCEKCNYLEKMRCPVKDSHKADIMATACRRVGTPITRPPMSWQFCVATEPRQTADTE